MIDKGYNRKLSIQEKEKLVELILKLKKDENNVELKKELDEKVFSLHPTTYKEIAEKMNNFMKDKDLMNHLTKYMDASGTGKIL
jgi:hypothetical protein